MTRYELTLPFPPTVNTYYRNVGGRVLISKSGRAYRSAVIALVDHMQMVGDLRVDIDAFPPDKRRRDLDNLLKPLLDALQHAGLYADDSQISMLSISRRAVVSGGLVNVSVTEMEGQK